MDYDVIICTYNGEQYIKEQIESILHQKIPPSCIYISDDGSIDQTVSIAKDTLNNSNVNFELTINKRRLGYAKNFINVLSKTKSEIVFFCDQDDIWVVDKIYHFENEINENNAIDLFFSDAFLVDQKLKRFPYSLWDVLNINPEQVLSYKIFYKRNIVTGATMAIRRRLIGKCLNIPNGVPHDYWIASVASCFGGIKMINEKLIFYRQHDKNVLGATRKSLQNKIFDLFSKKSVGTRIESVTTRLIIFNALVCNKYINYSECEEHYLFLNSINELHNQKSTLCSIFNVIVRIRKYLKFDYGIKGMLLDILICFKKN